MYKGVGVVGVQGLGRICGAGEDAEFDGCTYVTGGAGSAPNGGNWTQFIQQAINQGIGIARTALTPPTLQRDANGNLIVRSGNQPVPSSVNVGGASATGIPGWVWVAGGVGALALVAMSSKRR